MRFVAILMLSLALLLFSVNASANSYLYFQGFIEDVDSLLEAYSSIYAWDFENDTFTSLGIDGYLIDKSISDPGCYAVTIGENPGKINLIYCLNGRIEQTYTISSVVNIVRVYGRKGEWLYFAWDDPSGNYGICRSSDDGRIEYYNINGYIDSVDALEELIYSISETGVLAFASDIRHGGFEEIFGPTKLCIAIPNGKTFVINEDDAFHYSTWLNSEELAFVDGEEQLWVYNIQSAEKKCFTTESGEALVLNIPKTNLSISSDGLYVAYQFWQTAPFSKNYVDDIYNPLEIRSLIDGTFINSKNVCLSIRDTDFALRVQLGE